MARYCGTGSAVDVVDSMTTRPRPGLAAMSPSDASCASARRTVLRATLYSVQRFDSDGKAAPGANSPAVIRARNASVMLLYAPQGVRCVTLPPLPRLAISVMRVVPLLAAPT